MIAEGSKVAYAGDDPFQDVGSLGKIVSLSGSCAHVLWQDGPKVGMIEMIALDDLLPRTEDRSRQATTVQEGFESSLDMPGMPVLAVRDTYDEDGEDGLVTALDEAGRIATLAEYAEEAISQVAARIRTDPGLVEVLGQLESDEANSLVDRLAGLVLMDRVGEGE